MRPVDDYYFIRPEPFQSIMLYVRGVILKTLPNIDERYSYKIPFYNMGKKPMLYINVLKGTDFVDVAFVQGVLLEDNFPELKNYKNRKQVRSIQIKKIEDLDELRFVELIRAAVAQLEKSKKAWFI